jgi:thioredoxin-dependent peroxiredoxin
MKSCGSWIPASSPRTHKVATPVNWKNGEDVIIVPAVSDDEAKKKFPDGWKAPKPYLRIVPQPK